MTPRGQAAHNLQKVLAGHSLSALPCSTPLIKELTYGTLRWYFQLTAIAATLLKKPLSHKDQDIHALILIGLYQLLYMHIPEHAVLSETVEATKKTWAKPVINAVLRNFLRQKKTLLQRCEENQTAKYAHPSWLLTALQKAWPEHWEAIAEANNACAPMSLRVNLQKISRDVVLQKLAATGIEALPCPFNACGITLTTPCDVTTLPGFSTGEITVQDIASQLAAPLLDLATGMRVLDACAAPGGKATHILELVPTLHTLLAIDKDPVRVAKMQENFARAGYGCQVCDLDNGAPRPDRIPDTDTQDAMTPDRWWDHVPFDRILLDAPCSATGVIRRHPDIKLLRRASDLPTLVQQQFDLLKTLWPLLQHGGKLLYTTCSVLPEENENVIARFLGSEKNAHVLPIVAPWGIAQPFGRQILPGEANMDGFYYALLEKR